MATKTDNDVEVTTAAIDPEKPTPGLAERTVSLRLSTILTALALVALLVATAVFAAMYISAESKLSERDSSAAADRHAAEIASNYAVGASTIDYRDTKAWLSRLQSGTTAQLSAKFDATAPQLEQILQPLQWTSKATPLSATVTSESGGIYKVNAYLNVSSTSAQTPDGAQTTVTYSLTIDRNAEWKITDVGGLQNALPSK
ncbi:hypothetical protein [Nocardia sp. SYP-A9097]|uniref:hypothetical protein n=1 Tax=Nocardia sp. SYP-A9097 TaxID=2663237 RepID=UPI001E36621E|nr:hypothetical protein [Nocardia sp. SYP-A9097]